MNTRSVACVVAPRPFRLSAVAAVACTLAGGCADQAADNRSSRLTVQVVDDATTLDGLPATLRYEREATGLGLLRRDGRGELAPGLARSWNFSRDGLTYVFRLRPGAQWSDGKPADANTVARALRQNLAKAAGDPMLGSVKAASTQIDAPALSVLRLRLARPMPELLPLLAHPSLAIRDRQRAIPGAFSPLEGTQPELRANPRYFDAASVRVSSVELGSGTAAAAIRAFQTGRLDIVTGSGLGGMLAARDAGSRSGAFRLEPAAGQLMLVFGSDAGVLTDERVRLALSLVLNRAGLASSLFATPLVAGHAALVPPLATREAAQSVPPDWADEPLEDRQAAGVRLAAEAGLTALTPVTLTVDLPDSAEHKALIRALAASWETLGVVLRARARPPGAHARHVAAGRFQMALVERIAPASTPWLFLDPLRCGRSPDWLCSPAADAALDMARASGDPAERLRGEWLLTARTPVITLMTTARWSLVGPRVEGWIDNPYGAHPLADLSAGPAAAASR